MKKIIAILILIVVLVGCNNNQLSSTQAPQKTVVKLWPGRVTRVVDGDTVVVLLANGKKEKVRFIGINTPESTTRHEPYGKEAADYTRKQLVDKEVYLELDVGERDKYGRLLAYMWLMPPTKIDDGEIRKKMFNARLVTAGYAQLMTIPPNIKYADYFIKYQREAREGKKGLWGL